MILPETMKCAAFLAVLIAGSAVAQKTPAGIYSDLLDEANRIAMSDRAKSVDLLRQALTIESRDGQIWLQLGRSLSMLKRHDEAIEAFKVAHRFGAFENKFHATVEYEIACNLALKGDKTAAWEWLERSMASGYRDLKHVREDDDLESLRTDPRWETLAATKDPAKMSRDEGWRYDLWLMDREVRRIHFNPYRVTPKERLDEFVSKLHGDIPRLSDEQVATQFVRYMALIGDGHTGIRMPEGPMQQDVPVELFKFQEGVYVLSSPKDRRELAGLKVTHIAGRPIDEVWRACEPYVRKDNEMGYESGIPSLLRRPAFLFGAGLSPQKDAISYTLAKPGGGSIEVVLNAAAALPIEDRLYANHEATTPEPLYIKHRTKPYWFEYLPDSKVMYLQYNAVRNDPREALATFANRFFKALDESDVQALVVDCRWNGGGNTFLSTPLVRGIAARNNVNRDGKLFIIVGRFTFSACQNFVTDLGRLCEPIYVGEPTGSSPNFVGETIRFDLPFSKMSGSISDLYWQRSWPMDHRTWIAPELPAVPSIEFVKQNRDPAMEAILEAIKGQLSN